LTTAELPFADRPAAGKALAARLLRYRDREDAIVLALPRGGVPVATTISDILYLPMAVLPVRKICLPGSSSAIGAVAEGDVEVWNVKRVNDSPSAHPVVARTIRQARAELARFRQDNGQPRPDLHGRCVIIVDDGAVTGISLLAAIKAAKEAAAARVVAAIAVAPRDTWALLGEACDEVICVATPEPFHDIGQSYLSF